MNEDEYADDDFLENFEMPEDFDEKKLVLQIIDSSGDIVDVLFDIEDIYNYVYNVYKNCPERS
jgi:hypothetical protein